jgi:hypothetical protein
MDICTAFDGHLCEAVWTAMRLEVDRYPAYMWTHSVWISTNP